MSRTSYSLNHLTDSELEDGLHRIVQEQRFGLADLLSHLGEVDARKLYLGHACSALFTYCTTRLGFSESEAFKRTQAARLARTYPVIFTMVAEGKLHLSALNLLAPHLTADNHLELLSAASGKSKRVLEELLAARWPRPDAPTRLRQEPAPRPAQLPSLLAQPDPRESAPQSAPPDPKDGQSASPAALPAGSTTATGALALEIPRAPSAKRTVLEPLSEKRFRLQVTLSRNAHDTLRRLQALMRHSIPDGDLSLIIEKALQDLCDKVEARRLGKRRGRGGGARVSTPDTHEDGGHGEALSMQAGTRAPAEANADTTPTAAPASSAKSSPEAAPEKPTPASSKRSRNVTSEVRRQVVAREGFRCSYVDEHGNRCSEDAFVQFHHRTAFARGGASSADQMMLLCAPHHAAQTELAFGASHVRTKIAARRLQRSAKQQPGAAPAKPVDNGSGERPDKVR